MRSAEMLYLHLLTSGRVRRFGVLCGDRILEMGRLHHPVTRMDDRHGVLLPKLRECLAQPSYLVMETLNPLRLVRVAGTEANAPPPRHYLMGARTHEGTWTGLRGTELALLYQQERRLRHISRPESSAGFRDFTLRPRESECLGVSQMPVRTLAQ